MQSSAMNCLPVRLKASSHSRKLSRSGPLGAWPVRAVASVAVDKREPPEAGLRPAFASTTCHQPHRRADAASDEEARTKGSGRDDRELRADLRADVGRLADLGTEVVDGGCELVALGLDLAAHLLGRAVVGASCHRTSTRSWSASLRGSPAPERAESPS